MKNTVTAKLSLIAASVFLLWTSSGQAQTAQTQPLYYVPANPATSLTWRDNYTGGSACLFTVGPTNVVVSHLGYFSSNSITGLNIPHYVGIYSSAAAPQLLAQVIVPAGTAADSYTNEFYWMPLNPPFLLQSNTAYYVACLTSNSDGDLWGDSFTAVFNSFFVGGTTNGPQAPETAYGAGNYNWPIAGFSLFGSNTTYCVEGLANLPIDAARVGVQGTNISVGAGPQSIVGFASGMEPINYQWWLVGSPPTPVSGQTNANLIFANAAADNSGVYFLTASNALGGAQSPDVFLAVSASPVGIQTGPTNVTAFNNYPANFAIVVTGAPPVYVQWFTNGVADTSSTTVISGTDIFTNTYTAIAQNAANGWVYSVVVSNNVSSVAYTANASATLTVVPNFGYPQHILHGAPGTNIFYEPGTWNGTSGDTGNNPSGICGGDIVIGNNNILITHVGYDAVGLALNNQAALSVSHHVGIWNSSGNLLAYAILTNGTPTSSAINGYLWAALSPPLLLSNNTTYVVGGENFYEQDPWGTTYNIPNWDNYITPGGNNNKAVYINSAWPTEPTSGGYGSQMYTLPNMGDLIISNEVFAISTPDITTAAAGTQITLTGYVNGPPPVTVQWFLNGAALPGQTNITLIATNAGSYTLLATNVQTAVGTFSAPSTVILYFSPTIISAVPATYTNVSGTNLMTLYAGANPSFSIYALGAGTLAYQWYTNGVAAGKATNSTYQVSNVQAGGTVACIITNVDGSATDAWSATVIPDPTNSTGGLAPYPQSVLALKPMGYWRLNEPDCCGGESGPNDGSIATDYAGGNNGVYTNMSLGWPGYSFSSNLTNDPSDTSAQFGEVDENNDPGDSFAGLIAGVNFSSPSNTSVAFSVEAWVAGYTGPEYDAGIVTLGYGGGEQFDMDEGDDTSPASHAFRFFVRDAGGGTHLVNSQLEPGGITTWYHLVAVVDEVSNQLVSFYTNGVLCGTAAIAKGSGILTATNIALGPTAPSSLMSIGSRMGAEVGNFNYQYYGNINDVAVFNFALSSNQVLNQYLQGATIFPYFNPPPPANVAAVANGPMTIPAIAFGPGPMGYQWIDTGHGNAVLESGVTNGDTLNASYVTNSAPGALNGDTLELIVTNAYGSTNVTVATTVTYYPQILTNLPAQVFVGQGQSYTYTPYIVGETNLIYQWYENSSAVSGATNPTYAPSTAGGSTNTFFVTVTNNYGAVTSIVSTFSVVALPHTALAGAITALQPIAYWPMHEVEPAAQGDIETNYGTFGAQADGYYADWMQPNSGFTHDYACSIGGDPNSVFFNNVNSGGGSVTNAMLVNADNPGTVLNPPFTVECWCFLTQNVEYGDMWSQNGYEGINAGGVGGGGGSVCGIRFDWGGNGANTFTVYGYDNSSGLNSIIITPATIPTNTWLHCVVTCDAFTNFSVFTNGVLCSTNPGVGKYSPDYWTPFAVGSGRGYTRGLPATAVADVAIYTNVVLPTATILNHYQVGINPAPPTSYFNTVLASSPPVFLRMDSPAWTPASAPSPSALPVLYNYGSVLGNGVYTAGTVPGAAPGPSSTPSAYSGLVNQGTNVAPMSGVSSFADAGYNAAWDPSAQYGTGSNAFSVTCMFRGNPADNRYQTIFGHHDSTWKLDLTANAAADGGVPGSALWVYNGSVNSTNDCNDGKWHQMVGTYTPGPIAAPGILKIYIDGQFNNVNTDVSSNGINAADPGYDILLGAVPDYTNNGVGQGRQFDGQLCDVALFTNALTPAQVLALYNAAGGVTQTLAMPITGELPVTWNSVGTSLGNNLGPTNLMTLYAGASPSFSVTVYGTGPNFQWFTNGAAVGFGTNNTLTLPNVQRAFTTYCIVTNSLSSVTSVVWSASVAADPDAAGSFSQTILADNPMAYWRLNESHGSTIAIDYAGGANGLYGSQTTNGVAGVPIAAATPETSVAMDIAASTEYNGTVTNAGIVLNTNMITFVCWVLPTGNNGNPAGLFENRSSASSSGYQLNSSGSTQYVDYNWSGSSSAYNYGDPYGIPQGTWGMAVCEITPQNAQFYVYYGTNGLVGIATNFFNSQIESFFGGNEIGADPNGGVTRILPGMMNELAIFNYQLSLAQLNALYQSATNGALGLATIIGQPQNATVLAGATTNFGVGASSFSPLTYQWYYNTTASYAGATALANGLQANGSWVTNVTKAQFTITNVTSGAVGYYYAVVGNVAGAMNSAIAALTIGPASNATNIVFSVQGSTNLVLSWPANHTGWQLQAQTNSLNVGISTNWVNVSGSTGTNQVIVPINLTNGCVFYRLVY